MQEMLWTNLFVTQTHTWVELYGGIYIEVLRNEFFIYNPLFAFVMKFLFKVPKAKQTIAISLQMQTAISVFDASKIYDIRRKIHASNNFLFYSQ